MDVSKYASITEWRDDLHSQGYSIPLQACWALSQAMNVLGVSFQEAFDYLVRHEKIIIADKVVICDLSFQKLLEEERRKRL